MTDEPVTLREFERLERDVINLFATKASAVAMSKLEERVDKKADVDDVRELSKRLDRINAGVWALALSIVTASITFAITIGGHA